MISALRLGLLLLTVAASACVPVSDSETDVDACPATTSASTPEIYRQLSPSVAFVETPTGTGSGMLMVLQDQQYVVTNAHVVWPYLEARVVFPNREEHLSVPVAQTDYLVDLALLGPIDTSVQPVALSSQREFTTGDAVYLIGYPGEGEDFPDPAISRGILSRTRVWDAVDSLHYYQTDAASAGGQSGGIMVSNTGEVIGFSGLLYAETFVLAASGADMAPRLDEMAQTAALAPQPRSLPQRPVRKDYSGNLENLLDTQGFLIQAPYNSELKVEVSSPADLGIALFDSYGEEADRSDRTFEGTETVSTTVTTEGPYFVAVEQYLPGGSTYTLDSSHRLAPIEDPEDGQQITLDETRTGSIDYPGDIDWFLIPLERGETIEVLAESVSIDPVVAVGRLGAGSESYAEDDDSGRGMLGANALIEFRARRSDDYLIAVRPFALSDLGGYLLTVRKSK